MSGIWKCVPLGSALASRTSPSCDGQSNLPLLSEPGVCFRSTATCYGALRSVLLLVTLASTTRNDVSGSSTGKKFLKHKVELPLPKGSVIHLVGTRSFASVKTARKFEGSHGHGTACERCNWQKLGDQVRKSKTSKCVSSSG